MCSFITISASTTISCGVCSKKRSPNCTTNYSASLHWRGELPPDHPTFSGSPASALCPSVVSPKPTTALHFRQGSCHLSACPGAPRLLLWRSAALVTVINNPPTAPLMLGEPAEVEGYSGLYKGPGLSRPRDRWVGRSTAADSPGGGLGFWGRPARV